MIEVKNLRKAFNGEEVLKGLNFVFDRGKTNLIIGQSGSGKSVFLKKSNKSDLEICRYTINPTMK